MPARPPAWIPALSLASLAACAPAAPATPGEIRALAAGDCHAIRSPDLAAECLVFAVRADPARAGALCPQIRIPFWQDECWFMAADAADLSGEARREACQRAGRYQGPCIANALSRAFTRLSEDPALRCSDRLEAEVARTLGDYHRPAGEAPAIAARMRQGCP